MINNRDIKKAIAIIKAEGVVAAPTETAYGLIADAASLHAVKKIFLIKGRSKKKSLPLIAASFDMVKKFFYLNKRETVLAKRYWPGPLTILLKPKKKFPSALALGRRKLAVRVSSSAVVRKISARVGNPVTATSANKSGSKECYSAFCVEQSFRNIEKAPDIILDGGVLARVAPSTIIEVSGDKIKVLRQGQLRV